MSCPKKKFTLIDGIIIGSLFIACVFSFILYFLPGKNATHFTVHTHDGSETYSLLSNRSISVESNGISLEIVVENGSVSVIHSDCPDKICVETGAVSRPGQSIVCIPAEIVIEVTGEGGENDEDFIVG